MVYSDHQEPQALIHSIKISTVGPADVTGSDLIYEPENIDLAMKLHYIRGIYYFNREAFDGLNTLEIKEPMFKWLNVFPVVTGRLRLVESGWPYIKCNDCGVRFVEAKCEKTLDVWLQIKDAATERKLVPRHVLGPEIWFSPLVFLQLTKFKCGGTALGLSWAHVLGDAFCAGEFMNMLGYVVAGNDLGQPITLSQTHTEPLKRPGTTKPTPEDPISIKRVEPVGDHWINPTKSSMETFSFHVTHTQLKHLQSKFEREFTAFEAISALIWRTIATIRGDSEPKVVTICRGSKRNDNITTGAFLGNKTQVVSIVRANSPIAKSDLTDLAESIKNEKSDDREKIEEAMEREKGLADFFFYGANLTFVDLGEATFYEFDYRGQKPVSVSYWIDGIGDEGAAVVLRGPNEGLNVMTTLPENEIDRFKLEMFEEGLVMV